MLWTDGVHLVSDTSKEELHEFAAKIGLRRRWFQPKHCHYDMLSPQIVRKAVVAGAKLADPRAMVLAGRKMREKLSC
jgi:hypothetical protein